MMLRAKVVGLLILLIAGMVLYIHYSHIKLQNQEYRQKIKKQESDLADAVALLEEERKLASAAIVRAEEFQQQRAKSNEDYKKLRKCVDDGTCVARVRIKTSCPQMPTASTDTARAETAAAELAPEAERDILYLIEEAQLLYDRCTWMQKELLVR